MKDETATYRKLSLWLGGLDGDLHPRAPLPGDIDVDVAIVGAGYTGLWTAFYLLGADPSLRVAILEKEIAGFGASGRNGGWCSAIFAASHQKIADRYGDQAAVAMQKEMFRTVDEVGAVLAAERIDAGFHKGGTLTLATSQAQSLRIRSQLSELQGWGFGEEDFRWLDRTEVLERIAVPSVYGARYTPHCARLDPARLVRGLADRVEGRGAVIYEKTSVTSIEPGVVLTDRGTVKADIIVRATEGYTPRLPGMQRKILPLYSLMLATQPLSPDIWESIGWGGYETLHDGRHLLIYAQRTPDDRIAIGGRGAPYHFGSRISGSNDQDQRVFAALTQVLHELFPAAVEAEITHRWGGCLGVPRDWFSSVGYDSDGGLAWAGGYVGDGVATANLAGRTLRDLILKQDSELVRLPWVGHRSPTWEPEPLRWIGVNLGLKVMAQADRAELRTGNPSRSARLVKRFIGM
jgi:glycine/D-amino acid oxidase-like deaminating enzyme